MKLWHISQSTNDDYDTFDSAVVAAETQAEAKHMHPYGHTWVDGKWIGTRGDGSTYSPFGNS